MDIWDKNKRSECMSKIRSKNTKPELTLRKALFARGFRYRINDKRLPS
jgi:DNA mismatch endonuclease (patch repair protein)